MTNIIAGTPGQPVVTTQSTIESLQAQLNCSISTQYPDSPETILYKWTKDGQDIDFNNRTTGSMEIKPVHRSDAGNYVCTVSNVAGKSSAATNLTVYCKLFIQ